MNRCVYAFLCLYLSFLFFLCCTSTSCSFWFAGWMHSIQFGALVNCCCHCRCLFTIHFHAIPFHLEFYFVFFFVAVVVRRIYFVFLLILRKILTLSSYCFGANTLNRNSRSAENLWATIFISNSFFGRFFCFHRCAHIAFEIGK